MSAQRRIRIRWCLEPAARGRTINTVASASGHARRQIDKRAANNVRRAPLPATNFRDRLAGRPLAAGTLSVAGDMRARAFMNDTAGHRTMLWTQRNASTELTGTLLSG